MYSLNEINYFTVLNSMSIQTQLQVWGWVLNKQVSLLQKLTSPFRNDTVPDCWLREYKNRILFTDFADYGKCNWTVLHAINYFRSRGLNDAAHFVYYNLYFNTQPVITFAITKTGNVQRGRKPSSTIHFIPHTNAEGKACFVQVDKDFFQPVGVTIDDLVEMGVFSVSKYYLNGKCIYPKKPCFAYVIGNHVKIYCPYEDKKFKWVGNVTASDVHKTNLGNDKLLITKSLKDVLVLKKLLPNWTIISPQNEGVVFPYDYTGHVKCRVLYDGDKAGINASAKLLESIPIKNKKSIFFDMDVGKDAYEIGYKDMQLLNKELKRLKLI